jgi:NAD(P)-dependent dehydrogenase (short-subunit alcohol dehydrogenase family)
VIVTGAARGIRKGVAAALLERGAAVLLVVDGGIGSFS